MQDITGQKLYDLLVTRDFDPEILDKAGKPITDPTQADLFSFDFKTADNNYGTVVVLLGQEKNLEVYYGDNLGRGMESQDKRDWYAFLEQLSDFAARNMLEFEINDINKLKYTMQGMAAIKEGLFEGYYGTRKVSYSDQPKKTRLVIKHSRDLGEGEARHRNIDALFVETEDGSRFRLPFKKLLGGRVMARHCAEGGTPYDAFGQHITQMIAEMNTMSRFVRAARGRGFTGEALAMVESAIKHYAELKDKAKRMISQRGYHEEREHYRPDRFTDSEVAAEAIRDMFIEQTLDHRIEEALPVLSRIAQQEQSMKEADMFESWADQLVEGTWALPTTKEDQARLQDLMSQELIVGPDATNATEQLYDLVGDDTLFDILSDIADADPDANVWDNARVWQRLSQLGIQRPATQATAENFGGGGLQGAPVGVGSGMLEKNMEEDLDPEGIMRTVPSNMSSESQHRPVFNRLVELAKG